MSFLSILKLYDEFKMLVSQVLRNENVDRTSIFKLNFIIYAIIIINKNSNCSKTAILIGENVMSSTLPNVHCHRYCLY